MKITVLLASILALSALFLYSKSTANSISTDLQSPIEDQFLNYIAEFGKQYKDVGEMKERFENFKQANEEILAHQARESKFTLAHNQFSDWSKLELSAFLSLKKNETYREILEEFESESRGPVDWREAGILNPIKDQGACGSCWAFATQGTFESRYALESGELLRFSEQLLLDCDPIDQSCGGGVINNAFLWLHSHANVLEDDYKYTHIQGSCNKNAPRTNIYTKQQRLVRQKVNSLKGAVEKHPVGVSIQANQPSFLYYSSGIITQCVGQLLDHAVILVGWGNENGTDYWIIRNSWNQRWGENGYARIHIEEGCLNSCGILQDATTIDVFTKSS